MIEKMSFVTLAGPKTEIDYLVDHYLSKHDIHLENALSELSSAEQFTTFTEENPFKAMLTKSRELMLLVKNPEKATISKINVNKAQKFIDKIDEQIDDIRTEVANLEKQMDALNQDYAVLAPFKTLNYSLKGIYDMEFFKYRFGKIPRSEFDKFESYLDPDMDEIFLTCLVESEYVYGVFFAPIDKFNEVAKDFPAVRMEHRTNGTGLATAVLRGFKIAKGEYLACMDADLQHPPIVLKYMYKAMESGADFCIPSRLIPGGDDGGLNWYRKFVSWTARKIGQVMLPCLRKITDPTSGLFMFRKEVIEHADLQPIGWKIMVEVLAMGTYKKVIEIPYKFQQRTEGESKLSGRVTMEYLKQLMNLRKRYNKSNTYTVETWSVKKMKG